MSCSTASGSSSQSAEQLLEAIAFSGDGEDDGAVAALAAARASGAWPVSPAACLYAAVKTQRAALCEQLLQTGVEPQFLVADLPPADRAALNAAGLCVDGIQYWSPLVIAVRQHSLDVARALLQHGAPANRCVAGQPLLLHYLEGAAAAAATVPHTSDCPCLLRSCDCARLACSSRGPSSSGRTSPGCSGGDGGSSGATSAPVPPPWAHLPPALRDLEQRLQLLWLLLQHGADPFQPSLGAQPHTFMTACRHPALLRLAVLHVEQQCLREKRRLSDAEARQLVAAASGAFFGGF